MVTKLDKSIHDKNFKSENKIIGAEYSNVGPLFESIQEKQHSSGWRVCVFNNVTYQFTKAGNGWNVEGSASAEILDPIVRGQSLTGGALILAHVGLQFSSGLLAERQLGSGACQVSDNLHKNSSFRVKKVLYSCYSLTKSYITKF